MLLPLDDHPGATQRQAGVRGEDAAAQIPVPVGFGARGSRGGRPGMPGPDGIPGLAAGRGAGWLVAGRAGAPCAVSRASSAGRASARAAIVMSRRVGAVMVG